MAQEKGHSNKNSPSDSEHEEEEINNGNNTVKPDLGFENVNYTNKAQESEGNRTEKSTASEPGNHGRKEESAISFKHFLKRDLSLPSTSASASTSASSRNSYEGTGARPKVIASHSQQPEARGDRDDMGALGLPSLPDFVQDHLLLEQAYLGAGAPLDLDSLPDFTFTQPGLRPPTIPPTRLALDLTDCVERPQPAPHPFPLDLPNASGGEGLRLPDFLPSRSSGRSERERDRRRAREREETEDLRHAHHQNASGGEESSLVTALRLQIEQLKDELRASRAEVEELRGSRRGVARSLLYATNTAESSLRELLSGLEQVRSLASSLEPP